mgnify:CR=1 FL=1
MSNQSLLHEQHTGLQNALFEEREFHTLTPLYFTKDYMCNTKIINFGERVKLKHLIFNSNLIETVCYFKALLSNALFEITFDGNIIERYNFSLIMELNEVQNINGNFVVTLPNYFTIDKFRLDMLDKNVIRAKITNLDNHELFTDIILMCDYMTYLPAYTPNTYGSDLIQDLREVGTFTLKHNKSIYNLNLITDGTHLTKGYFIEGMISKINKFAIHGNGHELFTTFDKTMFNLYCHHISDTLTYFSYSGLNDYETMTLDSYKSALNQNNVDSVRLVFGCDTDEDDVGTVFIVYSLSLSYLNYSNKSMNICSLPLVQDNNVSVNQIFLTFTDSENDTDDDNENDSSNNTESDQDESDQDENNQDENNQDENNQNESNQNESNQNESNQNENSQNENNQNENQLEDYDCC